MKRMKTLLILILILAGIVVLVSACMSLPTFGAKPKGERLERMKQSPNFKDGVFVNQEPTPAMVRGEMKDSINKLYRSFIHDSMGDVSSGSRKPSGKINAVSADLRNLPSEGDWIVWFGHSSYLLQVSGVRFLVDPVFGTASPVWFVNKPVEGSDIYKPEDLPNIDYLIITHDHYDHMDYTTCKKLRKKVRHAVCPLGVDAHLERWGYRPGQIVEMDWNKSISINGVTIYCLPQRHFSGRTFKRNPTLWASFMIETDGKTIFVAGDGGYGRHFKEIGKRFPAIDLAILENGQYNPQWPFIHTLPYQLRQVIDDLGVKQILTVHHGKYAEALHPWEEPERLVDYLAKDSSLTFIRPAIGELTSLKLR